MLRSALVLLALGWAMAAMTAEEEDPFLWLEEIDGERAMAWVKEQNARSTAELEAVPEYKPVLERTLAIMDSEERIPMPSLRGNTVYNFWQDKEHERGIWRRASLASYRTEQPAWETVLDVDALSKADGVPWAFKSAAFLPPEYRRCMVSLSRGGGDAVVWREFDAASKTFVEGGFSLEEAKSEVAWRDQDTLWVGTDFGEGSLTTSGYPRIAKLWKRGQPLAAARTVFEGLSTDVAVGASSQFTPEGRYDMVVRSPAFYRSENFLMLGDRLVKLDVPEDANFNGFFKDHLLLSLRSDWSVGGTTYSEGALLAIRLDDCLRGKRTFDVLFQPTDRSSLSSVANNRDRLLVAILDNVRGKLESLTLVDGAWQRQELPLPGLGTVYLASSSDDEDLSFFVYTDFLTPQSLHLLDKGTAEKVKSAPAFFTTDGMTVAQYEATSKDGTKIPYFLVTPKGFTPEGKTPTLLYGYGGFENPELPFYSGVIGSAWLERGGAFALANLRGGGEFGPRWHKAALKENRIKSFEDFIAIGEDLVARKITSSRHLGIMGGSQGGLLVTGSMTLRPDLFHAVVSQVPLTDMRRFNQLLAGASWMAEYGNPDVPEEWAYIKTWSPYQLLRKDVTYPEPFIWTTTRDDRVHPGHARKMVAKMAAQGHPVLYFENVEGGHGSGSVNRQRAQISALEYAYLWKMLR